MWPTHLDGSGHCSRCDVGGGLVDSVPVVGVAARQPDEDFSCSRRFLLTIAVERMQAWQRLARSHRLLITPHFHPVFLPFRFRPSPCEVTRPSFLLFSHIYPQQHAVMEILLAQSLELGMRLPLNAPPLPSTHSTLL
jgi:hypothetical protein